MKKELSTGKIIVLAILAILLAIALALALTDLVRNVLAEPVTHLFYFLGLLVKSTPQVLFWGMVLLFLLIVAGKSVEEVRKPEIPDFVAPTRYTKRERVAYWAAQVNQALRGEQYSHARLIEFLARMALELDAQEEHISVVEIRQRLERGEVEFPLEIENYLKARYDPGRISRPNLWQRVKENMARLWNSLPGKKDPASRTFAGRLTQADLEKVIQYLEEQLEVSYDG